ncbi:MAG: hypothetical protein AB2A00_36430 [Myxococcota bacterium]
MVRLPSQVVSSSGADVALVLPELPVSPATSVFGQHRLSRGAPAIALQTTALVAGAATVVVSGLALGPAAPLVAAPVVLATLWSVINRTSGMGNGALRAELAGRLGGARPNELFVGLCLAENNTVTAKLLTPRLDTDDNVGFLSISEDALLIRTEEGHVRIARDAIRRVSLERFTEMPYLRWIVVEHYDDTTLRKVLVSSREGATLRHFRDETLALHARLTHWYLEPYMREALPSR